MHEELHEEGGGRSEGKAIVFGLRCALKGQVKLLKLHTDDVQPSRDELAGYLNARPVTSSSVGKEAREGLDGLRQTSQETPNARRVALCYSNSR